MLGVPSKAEPEQHWLPHRILEKIVLLSWEQFGGNVLQKLCAFCETISVFCARINSRTLVIARQVQKASVNPPSQCVRESGISRRDMSLKLYETNFRREDYGDLPKGRDCISSGCRPTRGTNSGWSYEL